MVSPDPLGQDDGASDAAADGRDEVTGAGDERDERDAEPPGQAIVRFDVRATAVFAVVSAAAAALPDPFEYLAVPLAIALFVVGTGAFLWAYGIAVSRSRYDEVTLGGVFFLAGDVAPAPVAKTLRVALAVQVVVGVAVAAVRPFTALAAGVLAPMLGLGLMALWGARHGRFPAKGEAPVSPGRGSAGRPRCCRPGPGTR